MSAVPAPPPAPSPSPAPATARRALTAAVGLAFAAGYVDTVGFIALFGLFTAHVTGNFVLIGSELARPSHGVVMKFLAFPAFIAAVAAARLIALREAARGRPIGRRLGWLQCLLLAAAIGAAWWGAPIVDAESAWAIAAGVLIACAMGVQNAASRLAWGHLSPTTVMTGNVTQLVIDLVDLARGADDPALRPRLQKFFWPVVGFGCGAIAGGYAFLAAGLWSLVLPLAMLGAMAALGVLD